MLPSTYTDCHEKWWQAWTVALLTYRASGDGSLQAKPTWHPCITLPEHLCSARKRCQATIAHLQSVGQVLLLQHGLLRLLCCSCLVGSGCVLPKMDSGITAASGYQRLC